LSSRHFNEITKINRSDSSIIWRFGGKRNEFTFLNDTVPFYGQHDIRRLSNGNVTLYDNGWNSAYGPVHPARALEYTIDETAKTATLVWSYTYDSLYSRATGNMQRLPNGNTLVNYGFIDSLHNVTFVVVDSTGSKVFEIAFDDTCYSYRAFNFQSLPWTFHRPEITCEDSAGTQYLVAEPGHASYYWSNGATTQAIPVNVTDTYYVFVPYGTSGYISSERFYIDSLNDPCGLHTRTNELSGEDDLKIFPNPFNDRINLYSSKKISSVEIFDLHGRLLLKNMFTGTPDLPNVPPGMYIIKVFFEDDYVVRKLIKN
jgi:hypothetical protein